MKHLLIIACLFFSTSLQASDVVGGVATKGTFFKDKIKVVAFDDPDISGVTCYTTYYDRSLSISDSSSTSIACRQTGPISGNWDHERMCSVKIRTGHLKRQWLLGCMIVSATY